LLKLGLNKVGAGRVVSVQGAKIGYFLTGITQCLKKNILYLAGIARDLICNPSYAKLYQPEIRNPRKIQKIVNSRSFARG